MRQTGDFLGDFLGEDLSIDSIKEYANKLKQENQIPFIHFIDESLEDELFVVAGDRTTTIEEGYKSGEALDIERIYGIADYKLKRGPLFYGSNFEINYSLKTWVIFTQDGLMMKNHVEPENVILYPWDLWGKVLYTQHAHLAAPVILLAYPTQPGVPEMSISPVFDMKFNGKIYKEVDQNGNEVTGESYDDLTLEKMNFAYQILSRFYVEVVDKNRNSNSNEIPLEIFSLLYKKDFKIFNVKEKGYDETDENKAPLNFKTMINAYGRGDHELVVKCIEAGNPQLQFNGDNLIKVEIISLVSYYEEPNDHFLKVVKNTIDLDVRTTDEDGYTALHFAAWDGKDKLLKVLLENGASPNILGNDQYSPIQLAVANGHIECVKLLAPFVKDFENILPDFVNYFGNNSTVLLKIAVLNGFLDIAELLIKSGADPSVLANQCEGSEGGSKTIFQLAQDLKSQGVTHNLNLEQLSNLEKRVKENKPIKDKSNKIEDDTEDDSNKGFPGLRVKVKKDENGNNDEKLNEIVSKYLVNWQCATEAFNGRMSIEAKIPSWIAKIDTDLCCPKFTDKEIDFINKKITNKKIIPVLKYVPDEFYSATKSVWWVIPFSIWKGDVASWVFIDKNGLYAPHPDDEDVTHIFPWSAIKEVEYIDYYEMSLLEDDNEVHTLKLITEDGLLTLDEFVPEGRGSYLSVLKSIYDIRKKTIEASAGEPMWFEGAGGEGFKAFDTPTDLLSDRKWEEPDRPNPAMFGYIKEEEKDYELYNAGLEKYENKDYQGAIDDFTKGMELNQEWGRMCYYRGKAKVELKDYQGALEDFNKAFELDLLSDDPKWGEPYLLRGIVKSNLKDLQGAIEDFNKAIEFDRKSAASYFSRGSAKRELKDFQSAIKDFNKAIEIDSDWWGYYSSRAGVKSTLKDYQGAIEDYSKVIELNPNHKWTYQDRGKAKSNLNKFQEAIEDFNKVIEIDPNYIWAYQERGKAKSNLKEFNEAIEDFSKVIEIDPNYKWAYQERGEAKSRLEDYQGAIDDFSKVIEIDPNYKWAYEHLGIAKSKLKDYQGAIEDFNNAIEKEAKWGNIYYNRGLAKHDLKEYNGALEDYNYCVSQDLLRDIHLWYNIELAKSKLQNYRGEMENLNVDAQDSNYVNAYFNRAENVWEPLGLRKKEIEDLNKVIEIDSKHLLAYQNRGQAKSGLKDYQGAIDDFSKVIEISPDIAEAYYNRADPKYDLEDYKGAIEDYNKAIDLNPNYKIAYSARGITKSMINNYHGAIDDLSKAIEIDPDYKWAYQNRGKAKSNLKDYKGAIKDFNKAIELDPNDKELAEKRDKVKQLLEAGEIKVKKEVNEISNKKLETVEDYNKEIEENPAAFNYCGRGILKYEKKDYYSAIADLLKAIEIDPNYAKAYAASADVKKALNDVNGALADYNKALELEPDNKKFIEKRDNLTGSKSNVDHKSDKGVSQKGNVVSFNDIDTWLEIVKNGRKENKELGIKAIKPANISKKSEVVVRELFNRIKTTYADGDENLVFKFSVTGGCTVTYNKKKVSGFGFWTKGRNEILILRDYDRNYFRPNIKNLNIENIREAQISKQVPWGYAFYTIIDMPENINENMDKIVGLIGDGITIIKYDKVLSLKKNQFRKLRPIFEGTFDI